MNPWSQLLNHYQKAAPRHTQFTILPWYSVVLHHSRPYISMATSLAIH